MTVQEVETKRQQLELERDIALEAAKVLVPATPEFDEAYERYLSAKASLTKIPAELAAAKLAQNAGAIQLAGVTVGEGIRQLVDGLGLEELLGTKVIAIRYTVNAEGKIGVVFNPVIALKSTGPKAPKTPGTGRTKIGYPDGTSTSPTKFVLAHTTEAEKATPAMKYPHTLIDSKPKFDAFVASHNLVGYTYAVPEKAS